MENKKLNLNYFFIALILVLVINWVTYSFLPLTQVLLSAIELTIAAVLLFVGYKKLQVSDLNTIIANWGLYLLGFHFVFIIANLGLSNRNGLEDAIYSLFTFNMIASLVLPLLYISKVDTYQKNKMNIRLKEWGEINTSNETDLSLLLNYSRLNPIGYQISRRNIALHDGKLIIKQNPVITISTDNVAEITMSDYPHWYDIKSGFPYIKIKLQNGKNYSLKLATYPQLQYNWKNAQYDYSQLEKVADKIKKEIGVK